MKFVTFPDLGPRFGIKASRVTLWRLERAGRFPKRVRISPNRVGWIESEIVTWIAQRAKARGEADAA